MEFRPGEQICRIRGKLLAGCFLILGCVNTYCAEVHFNRDIRPILSDACFSCHGFDANTRKANLRLDTPEGATTLLEGRHPIKPGDPHQSEVMRRITSKDAKTVMPPPESHKTLTESQIKLVGQWIKEGAKYQKHWAFEAPVRPERPQVKKSDWPKNEIDHFILARLEEKQLAPADEAKRETLIRRLSLDLTGLAPTPSEVAAFVKDTSPEAYGRVLDRLLKSPQYGEHMARYWLDVARYGDTHGLHLDNERSMWAYRDWVVEAFNKNLPFDKFTTWQLAGDLLPEPTREQLIASGFNRCNVSTSEGGAIDEEFQVRYAVDRVETASTAWMGLTMGCAVCHDHKLDPISQKEFYQVFSIFNNMAEAAMDGNALLPPPTIQLPSAEQEKQLAETREGMEKLEKKLAETATAIAYKDPAQEPRESALEPKEIVLIEDEFPANANVGVNAGNEAHKWVSAPEAPVFSGKKSILRGGKGLHQVYYTRAEPTFTAGAGDKLFTYVYLDGKALPKSIMVQFHSGEWKHRMVWGDVDAIEYGAKGTTERAHAGALPESGKWVRLEFSAEAVGLAPGTAVTGIAFTAFDGTVYWDKFGRIGVEDPAQDPRYSFLAWVKAEKARGGESRAPKTVKESLKKDLKDWSEEERKGALKHFLEAAYIDKEAKLVGIRAEIQTLKDKKAAIEKEIPATMVSKELEKPRPAFVLVRGEYDKHGEPVAPGVPSILPPLPAGEKTNRLSFARWLVDPAHPLTARVTVNRLWQQFFGIGLVKTSEDFGTKSEWPSHPELLDWLATELVSSGWDLQHIVRLIVTSSAYRQDSKVSPALLALDPENRLLARGPRHRLDAEVIRDNALHISGLLNVRMGGRGVRSYQPPGIWEAVGYTTSNTAQYRQDSGEALYRRSLYLFWKRTAPPPSMTTFDAPSREQCRVRRERTNTPLQALLTMNDPQHVEASRHFGYRMMREGGASDKEKLQHGFKWATSRMPTEAEAEVLEETLAAMRAHYAKNPEGAKQLLAVGETPVPADVPAPEVAAFSMVANLVLNLDEVLTKN